MSCNSFERKVRSMLIAEIYPSLSESRHSKIAVILFSFDCFTICSLYLFALGPYFVILLIFSISWFLASSFFISNYLCLSYR